MGGRTLGGRGGGNEARRLCGRGEVLRLPPSCTSGRRRAGDVYTRAFGTKGGS